MTYQDAYDAGWVAFLNGEKRSFNPFNILDQLEYTAWLLGWIDCKEFCLDESQ